MPYTLPAFNLNVKCYSFGSYFPNPARLAFMANLTPGRRVSSGIDSGGSGVGIDMMYRYLLVPALTDIRGSFSATGPDQVEVPIGTGRYYLVQDVDDVAKGFANEHRIAWLIISGTQPVPLP
jgi:hypothetical protein